MMAFVPNRPLKLIKPMMSRKQHNMEEYILQALPNTQETKITIQVVRSLSYHTFSPVLNKPPNDEIRAFLKHELRSDYDDNLKAFHAELQKMERRVATRNQRLLDEGENYPFIYDALQPSRVGLSIDI